MRASSFLSTSISLPAASVTVPISISAGSSGSSCGPAPRMPHRLSRAPRCALRYVTSAMTSKSLSSRQMVKASFKLFLFGFERGDFGAQLFNRGLLIGLRRVILDLRHHLFNRRVVDAFPFAGQLNCDIRTLLAGAVIHINDDCVCV